MLCLHGGTLTGDIYNMSPVNYTSRNAKTKSTKTGLSASRKAVPSPDPQKPRRIAYIRVSTDSQKTALQDDAIERYGCDLVFREKASGKKRDRIELQRALEACNPGDTFVVWKLDRLGRLVEVVKLVDNLLARDVDFVSITEGFDARTPVGTLVRNILASVAEYEVANITERVRAGVKAAQARGVQFGPTKKVTKSKLAAARKLLADPEASVTTVARTLGVGRTTLYRSLQTSKDA